MADKTKLMVSWKNSKLISTPGGSNPEMRHRGMRQSGAWFEQDFLHAEPIDPNTLKDKSIWWRIGVRLSRLASPVL
ncbi:MAG: hypothetical protein N2C12_11160 [Planctomycetales bacterium]